MPQGHQLASSVGPSYFSFLHSQGTTPQLNSLYGEQLTCHSSQGGGCGEQHPDAEGKKGFQSQQSYSKGSPKSLTRGKHTKPWHNFLKLTSYVHLFGTLKEQITPALAAVAPHTGAHLPTAPAPHRTHHMEQEGTPAAGGEALLPPWPRGSTQCWIPAYALLHTVKTTLLLPANEPL